MSAHTPGPWRCVSIGHRDLPAFDIEAPVPNGHGSGTSIVTCLVSSWSTSNERVERMPGDATLIAAAPDLLAACVALIRGDDLQAAIELARAALAKAEGRS